jgi:hypothetical protein
MKSSIFVKQAALSSLISSRMFSLPGFSIWRNWIIAASMVVVQSSPHVTGIEQIADNCGQAK